jgi:hypothetical protein
MMLLHNKLECFVLFFRLSVDKSQALNEPERC